MMKRAGIENYKKCRNARRTNLAGTKLPVGIFFLYFHPAKKPVYLPMLYVTGIVIDLFLVVLLASKSILAQV